MFWKLFKRSSGAPELRYDVYLSRLNKYREVTVLLQSEPSDIKSLLICFFEETIRETEQLLIAAKVPYHNTSSADHLKNGVNLIAADNLRDKHATARSVYLMEIHPLFSINQKVIERFANSDLEIITCFMGMDEPLMQFFGSERITSLMKKLGLQPDEKLNHPMISKSIIRAQKKLDENNGQYQHVISSQNDWLEANKHLSQ